MSELFVDTSAWYPLANPREAHHTRLAALLAERVRAGSRIVTTNLVVAETHALLLRRDGRRVALTFLDEVFREPILVESSTPEVERRALHDWLSRFEDQSFTLTDAVSFVVMTDRGVREALALDRHFAVAGFNLLV
ncbi:MAG: PIN domain-containing protein [Gemmatimonadetes bacterium]|nr:PIN domain-containing protein [Gemmatimonadota bacterium]